VGQRKDDTGKSGPWKKKKFDIENERGRKVETGAPTITFFDWKLVESEGGVTTLCG